MPVIDELKTNLACNRWHLSTLNCGIKTCCLDLRLWSYVCEYSKILSLVCRFLCVGCHQALLLKGLRMFPFTMIPNLDLHSLEKIDSSNPHPIRVNAQTDWSLHKSASSFCKMPSVEIMTAKLMAGLTIEAMWKGACIVIWSFKIKDVLCIIRSKINLGRNINIKITSNGRLNEHWSCFYLFRRSLM